MKPCDHITGGQLCTRRASHGIDVPVPRHGPVTVNLCFGHRNTSDPGLQILAKAKVSSHDEPRAITPADIVRGLLVADASSSGLACVAEVATHGVRLQTQEDRNFGCPFNHLVKHYFIPVTPKHHARTQVIQERRCSNSMG